jgi:glucose/arabinose dehydrogenase
MVLRGKALAALCACLFASSEVAAQVLPPVPRGDIAISLQPVATGLGGPTYLTTVPGDTTNRQFVVDQVGLLRVIQNGTLLPTPALDIRAVVTGSGFNPGNANEERGFLGAAFHPGFNNPASPGFRTLYTYESTALAGTPTFPVPVDPAMGGTNRYQNVISEWKISASNPNVVDPNSRRDLFGIGKDASNHNGGTIAFGPDGHLYLATGDGGNANDRGAGHIEATGGNAQNRTVALGKMLRIDPIPTNPGILSANGQYRIPSDNPFVNEQGVVREIYATGFRNPFRYSFDKTGRLLVGDVGQGTIEEVDIVTKGGNYGWAQKEGSFLFNRLTGAVSTRTPVPGLIDPVLEYDHASGIAVIGGFVYHGSAIPQLDGKYIFGDLTMSAARATGRLFYADLDTGEIKEFLLAGFAGGILGTGMTLHGFGEDLDGELYALITSSAPNGTGGVVFRLAAAPIPEPGSLVLLGIGIAGLLGYNWRRRKLCERA